MKTFLLILAVCTLFSGKLVAQSYLSPRVGNEIDMDEKSYFGLFPSVNGFISAKATSQNTDSTRFTIHLSRQEREFDTSFSMDTRTVVKLSKYIEDFESVRMDENVVNWSVFKGLAGVSSAIDHQFRKPIYATVTTLDGSSFTGKLLWSEDSALVLWKSDAAFHWREVPYNASVLKVHSISTISLDQPGRFEKGLVYGLWVGLGATLVYTVANYKDVFGLNNERTRINIGFYLFPAVIAGSGFIGGIVSSMLLPDSQSTIDGKEENYRLISNKISKSSVIDSYPPPELIRLIESTVR